jgi:hypothetical protein
METPQEMPDMALPKMKVRLGSGETAPCVIALRGWMGLMTAFAP